MTEERDQYGCLLNILISPQGAEKIEAMVLYFQGLIAEGKITWPPEISCPSQERLKDMASYMSPVFATLSREEAEKVLQARTLLYLNELMVEALRHTGGWDAEDRRFGMRLVR